MTSGTSENSQGQSMDAAGTPADTQTSPDETFAARIRPLVETMYADTGVVEATVARLVDLVGRYRRTDLPAPDLHPVDAALARWSARDAFIIAYGDSVWDEDEMPLHTLGRFADTHLSKAFSGVHILPFFFSSSDEGFAVMDYLSVDVNLGDWSHIGDLSQTRTLMVDLVLNHVSSHSAWFNQFREGQAPGKDYFVTADPALDLSNVVRPRSHDLLTPVETVDGTRHVWTTFSADQVDLDYANPDVLLEVAYTAAEYLARGAKYLRLDAVAYAWKEIGTDCINRPQTHALVRLLREVCAEIDPGVSIITETNLPTAENLSYFGNGNEAHLIYNFSLPPLILHALLFGTGAALKRWMMRMPPAPLGCTYFNFTASHDGIGVRPAESLLEQETIEALCDVAREYGGRVSTRRTADGRDGPYEINITLFDALKGTAEGPDHLQLERFWCSQAIMMALEGIPAFYINSLFATQNDTDGFRRTGAPRSLNRKRWRWSELDSLLRSPDSDAARTLAFLTRLLEIRSRQPAFHPNATQFTLQLDDEGLFGVWRQSLLREQSIFAIHNLTAREVPLRLSSLNLIGTEGWVELIADKPLEDINGEVTLAPYQTVWISNRPH